MAGEGYLPPVVVAITGDATDFFETLAEVKAALADFAGTVTNTQLGADPAQFEGELAAVKTELVDFAGSVYRTQLGADMGLLEADLALASALLAGFGDQSADANAGLSSDRFLADLAALQALLQDLGTGTVPVNLGLDQLEADVAIIKAELAQLAASATHIPVTLETAQAFAEMEALKAELMSLGGVSIPVNLDVGQALVDAAALRASLDALQGTLGAGLSGAIGGAERSLGGAGGALSAGALMTSLGFGQGSITGIFTAIGTLFSAGFLSIASLAGFGPEHLLTTLIGLAGSLAGAIGGGLLLAMASFSVAAVGFGTDLAGIGQAAGDIKNVVSAQDSLNTAIAEYGPASTQAADAQAALNYQLSSFNPVARAAVENTANLIQALKTQFDAVTGVAEKIGAEIIGQAVKVGQSFLPTIGKYATENMGIIQADLQPFFAWLQNPAPSGGLGIFTELEKVFQSNLPTAISAATNAFELFAKTMAYLAPQTGKFLDALNKFFTHYNTSGLDDFLNHVQKLVNLFHVWASFLDILAKDVADIFGKAAGLGSGIIQELTGYLNELHKALTSGPKDDSLSTLFRVHKAEVLELIQVVIQLGVAIGKMYLIAAPAFTEMAILLLKLVSGFITLASKIPGGAAALGIALIAAKMGILGPLLFGVRGNATLLQRAFDGIGSGIGILVVKLYALTAALGESIAGMVGLTTESAVLNIALGSIGILALAAAVYELVKHWHELGAAAVPLAAGLGIIAAGFVAASLGVDVFDAALWASGIPEIILGIVALGVALYELVKHFRAVSAFLHGPWGIAIAAAVSVLDPLLGAAVLIMGHWHGVESFFESLASFFIALPGRITGAWDSFVNFFERLPSEIVGGLEALPSLLGQALKLAMNLLVAWPLEAAAFMLGAGVKIMVQFAQGLAQGAVAVFNFFTALPGRIAAFFTGISLWLLKAGMDLLVGFGTGIVDASEAVFSFFISLPGKIISFFASSPTMLTSAGTSIISGLLNGLHAAWSDVINWFTGLPSWFGHVFDGAKNWLVGAGEALIDGLKSGILSAWHDLTSWITGAAHDIIGAFKTGFGIASPAATMIPVGAAVTQGLTVGMQSNAGVAVAAAASIADQISKAFGSLTVPAKAASAVKALASFYSSLASVFTNLNTLGSMKLTGLSTAIANLNALALESGGLVSALKAIEADFKGVDVKGAISNVTGFFGAISKLFNAAAGTVRSSGHLTDLQGIVVELNALALSASGLQSALQVVERIFKPDEVTGAISNVSGLFGAIAKLFNAVAVTVRTATSVSVTQIASLEATLTSLGSVAGSVVALQRAFASTLTAGIEKNVQGLFGAITLIFQAVSATIRSAVSAAQITTLQTALKQLASVATSVSALQSAFDSTFITGAESNIQGLFGAITKIFNAVSLTVGSIGSSTGIESIVMALQNVANEAAPLSGAISSIETTLQSVSNVLAAFPSKISGASGPILSAMKALMAALLAAVKGTDPQMTTEATNLVAALVSGIKTGEKTADSAVADFFSSLTTSIVADKAPSAAAMLAVGQDLVTSLGVGMQDESGSPVTIVAGIVSSVTGYLNSTGVSAFHSAGANLMHGLSVGISSAAAAVTTAAVSAANSALLATQHATKTASPSQVYAEEGQNWMLGLVQGIRAGAAEVQGALNASVPRVPTSGYAPGGIGLGGAGGVSLSVNATFNINAAGGNTAAIKTAIEGDSAQQFAKQLLVSLRAGAGTVYSSG